MTKKGSMQDIPDELIAQAARGDIQAFERIVRTYGDMVFNVSLRIVRHRQDAEEVTQEVFMTLHRKIGSFQGHSSLKTWIYRVTVNTALNYTRRLGWMKARTVVCDEQTTAAAGPEETKKAVDMEHTAHVVNRLLEVLSPQQRACIVLRSMEGLSYEDMAKALGIDINAVRSCLKRARVRMLAARKEVMHDGL